MNILVIGSGGREHALIWKLSTSENIGTIYATPGNAGIFDIAQHAAIDADSPDSVIDFCKDHTIGLVVIGPEAPLVDGLADHLRLANIPVFGPNQGASQLEGSKAFTKKICTNYNIPTAAYGEFSDAQHAKDYIKQVGTPIVVKADGLAAGKGVVIAHTQDEAFAAVDAMLVDKQFGDASSMIVVEEFLDGEELSFFALTDGKTVLPFGSAQDHKAVGEGDTGPNTGGMGTYSPAPVLTDDIHNRIMEHIVQPLVDGMSSERYPYQGIIFAGLMIKDGIPKLLEINVRFGDPETQSLMARLDNDLLPLLLATANGTLDGHQVRMKDQAAVCVVMAAKGYPGSYAKGSIIDLKDTATHEDVVVFHAGTARNEQGQLVANGGRVLGITALGATVKEAQSRAYKAVDTIDWQDGFCRRDIAYRAID